MPKALQTSRCGSKTKNYMKTLTLYIMSSLLLAAAAEAPGYGKKKKGKKKGKKK
jgi:hypothetical protein